MTCPLQHRGQLFSQKFCWELLTWWRAQISRKWGLAQLTQSPVSSATGRSTKRSMELMRWGSWGPQPGPNPGACAFSGFLRTVACKAPQWCSDQPRLERVPCCPGPTCGAFSALLPRLELGKQQRTGGEPSVHAEDAHKAPGRFLFVLFLPEGWPT